MAVARMSLAVVRSPNAVVTSPLAFASTPNATEYRPTFEASHWVPSLFRPTPPARKAALAWIPHHADVRTRGRNRIVFGTVGDSSSWGDQTAVVVALQGRALVAVDNRGYRRRMVGLRYVRDEPKGQSPDQSEDGRKMGVKKRESRDMS